MIERHGVATTWGYGPRFLHSTGQFHKGGPAVGRFLQLVHDSDADGEIPGKPFGLRALIERPGRRRPADPPRSPASPPCASASRPPTWPGPSRDSRSSSEMQLGFIGLGKMGGNMVHRIHRDSDHHVVAFDYNEEAVSTAEGLGATGVRSLEDLVSGLESSRARSG